MIMTMNRLLVLADGPPVRVVVFEPKFFRDFNAKADLSHVAASMPIRFLSAQALENPGILVQQMMSNNRISGIGCSPTPGKSAFDKLPEWLQTNRYL
jgi:hypothetical protein